MKPVVLFCLCFFVMCCAADSVLPNDAEYFWCSSLYNPYYPLNPLNVSLPLIHPTYSYPQPAFSVLPERSLYENSLPNGNLLAFANNTGCPSNCESIKIFIFLNGTSTLLGNTSITPNIVQRVPFSLQPLPKNESSVLLCAFYDEQSRVLLANLTVRIQVFKESSQQVSIEYDSMGLRVMGEPFFPVGFYFPWNTPHKFVALSIDEVHNAMQSPLPYRPPTPPDDSFLDYMQLASDMGIRVHFDMYELSQEINSPSKWERIKETVDVLKHHDGLLAYYIADEPDGAGFGLDPSLLKEVYEFIKAEDPYHPVTLVLNCIHSAPRYVDCADIIMVDPYPIGVSQPVGCAGCTGVPSDVSNRIDMVLNEINHAKPLWVVIQAFGGPVEHWNRLPTWQEERAMSYLSIIHGAKGIEYFLEGVPYSRAVWAECRKVALEINSLSSSILSTQNAPVVSISSPQVHIASYYEEKYSCTTILVANTLNTPTVYEIVLPDVTKTSGTVLFENREVDLEQGILSDVIMGYGTHAYRFCDLPLLSSINAGNVLRNPSFEEQSNVGMADAMWIVSSDEMNSARVVPIHAQDGIYSQQLTNAGRSSDSFISIQTYIVAIPPAIDFIISFEVEVLQPQTFELSSSCLEATFSFTVMGKDILDSTLNLPSAAQCSFTISLVNKGTGWIDNLQLFPK